MGLDTVKPWDDFLSKLDDPALWESETARNAVLAGVEAATAGVEDEKEKLEKGRRVLSEILNGIKLIPGLLT